ncbi:MAG: ABC transporter ATP-binding protein [Rhodospirillales bacterium]
MSDPAGLKLTQVSKSFQQGSSRLTILKAVDLTVAAGEMVALVGPSGAGKSTLLQIAGLLERPDSGEVEIAGTATAKLRDGRRTALRRSLLGFVYQYHHLLPEFSALENVAIPQMIAGRARSEAKERAKELLTKVHLEARLDHRPAKLSGGEQQRVAIARALANRPKVLLADEPTGNLDANTAEEVFALLRSLVEQEGVSALIATHNLALAGRMNRALKLEEGKVIDATQAPIDVTAALIDMASGPDDKAPENPAAATKT